MSAITINNNIFKTEFTEISEKVLKIALDFSYSGVLVINKNHTIIYINHWASEFLDIPIEKSLYRKTTDFFPNSELVKVMESGEHQKNKVDIRNNKDVIVTRMPLYDGDEIIGAIALFQDVQHIQQNEMEIRSILTNKGFFAKYHFKDIIHSSKELEEAIETAKIYAQTSSSILIVGESGTGKELFAQSIHNCSERKDAPFVAINCATLPEGILESELFGYMEASFTGAKKGGKIGLFQHAHKGTLFLDEIGELPLIVQSKLLRVLQERQIRPVGSDKIIPIDVRIIAATNRNIFSEVQNGNFRLDLMYRLNVLNLCIPSLRERKDDIEVISKNYLSNRCPALYEKYKTLIQEILTKLTEYYFPGNIRELRNILERLSLILQHDITNNDVQSIINRIIDKQIYHTEENTDKSVFSIIENSEKQDIINVLLKVKGSRIDATKELGISNTTLWRKMKKHNIT